MQISPSAWFIFSCFNLPRLLEGDFWATKIFLFYVSGQGRNLKVIATFCRQRNNDYEMCSKLRAEYVRESNGINRYLRLSQSKVMSWPPNCAELGFSETHECVPGLLSPPWTKRSLLSFQQVPCEIRDFYARCSSDSPKLTSLPRTWGGATRDIVSA